MPKDNVSRLPNRKKVERKAVLNRDLLLTSLANFDTKLKRKILTSTGYGTLHRDVNSYLDERASKELYAINKTSRITYVDALVTQFKRYTQTANRFRFRMITIALKEHSIRLDEATPDRIRNLVSALQKLVRSELRGLHHFGCTEIGIYAAKYIDGSRGAYILSIHQHQIVWRNDIDLIERVRDRLNRKYTSLLGGRFMPARLTRLSAETVTSRIYYMLKPLGGVHFMFGSKMNVKEQDFRPGVGIQVANVLGGITLPQLLTGGGDGLTLLKRTKWVAVKRLRSLEKMQREKLERLLD